MCCSKLLPSPCQRLGRQQRLSLAMVHSQAYFRYITACMHERLSWAPALPPFLPQCNAHAGHHHVLHPAQYGDSAMPLCKRLPTSSALCWVLPEVCRVAGCRLPLHILFAAWMDDAHAPLCSHLATAVVPALL